MHINDAILSKTGGVTVNQGKHNYFLLNGGSSLDLDDCEREFLLAQGAGLVQGAEMLTDPQFLDTLYWTEGIGWTLLTGIATIDGSNSAKSAIAQAGAGLTLVSGTRYIFTVGIRDVVNGEVEVGMGAFRLGVVFDSRGINTATKTISGGNVTGAPLLEASAHALMQIDFFSIRPQVGGNVEYHINDLWEYYLREVKGYTGSLDDMKMKFWTAP